MSETQERGPIVWRLYPDGTGHCEEHGSFQHYRGGPRGCPFCKSHHPHAEEPD